MTRLKVTVLYIYAPYRITTSSGLLPVELYSFLWIELAGQCWTNRLIRLPEKVYIVVRFLLYVWSSVDNILNYGAPFLALGAPNKVGPEQNAPVASLCQKFC